MGEENGIFYDLRLLLPDEWENHFNIFMQIT